MRAFEALLERHGVGGVGVNAVLGQAGVGKRLLYEYFGDLPGLAAAWAKQRSDPLSLGSRLPLLRRKLARLPDSERIAAVLVDYMQQLRKHPWAAQVMLAELSAKDPMDRALGEIRREIGAGYERLLIETQSFPNGTLVDLAFVLHAAASYLALRSQFAPDYNGVDLRSRAGWQAALRTISTVAKLAQAMPAKPLPLPVRVRTRMAAPPAAARGASKGRR